MPLVVKNMPLNIKIINSVLPLMQGFVCLCIIAQVVFFNTEDISVITWEVIPLIGLGFVLSLIALVFFVLGTWLFSGKERLCDMNDHEASIANFKSCLSILIILIIVFSINILN